MTTKELAAALDSLRNRLGADVLTLAYHCDADPGDEYNTLERLPGRWSVNNSVAMDLDAALARALSWGADPARCEAVRAALVACDAAGEGLPW